MKTTLILALALSAPVPESRPLTYSEAVQLSKQTGKPLVIWVGGEFCPQCVQASAEDFVHVFVEEFPGATAPATVVGVWEGNDLLRVGDMDWWVVGDKTFGHVPSVRRALANWRANRRHFRQSQPQTMGYSSSSYMMQRSSYSTIPMMQSLPVRASGG